MTAPQWPRPAPRHQGQAARDRAAVHTGRVLALWIVASQRKQEQRRKEKEQ